MKNKTNQEDFWQSKFGDDYISRNKDKKLLASNINLFSKIISKTADIKSIIEFGCNIGMNITALKLLIPAADFHGIEINKKAVEIIKEREEIEVYNESIIEFRPKKSFDLTLIKGVLIHINPEFLTNVYENLYTSSKRYICVAEYYNQTPVSIDYRGEKDKLFKRDFAGEMLDLYPDLKLIDYGFCYRRDPAFPKDDLTWFLMEKSNGN